MATTMNSLDLIDAELQKAAAPKPSNKKPIFLFLKEKQKATIRPLYNLDQCLVMQKHNKFDQEPTRWVNAICASEVAQQCANCAKVADDKKLTANIFFYLPIYVYSVVDTVTGITATYKEKDEAGNETEKPIKGIRVLELSSFGTIGQVLKTLRGFMKDPDNGGTVTGNDFTLEQVGAGQGKTFVVLPKNPKPIDPRIQAVIPTQDILRTRILEALPPAVVGATPVSNGQVAAPEVGGDDIPVF